MRSVQALESTNLVRLNVGPERGSLKAAPRRARLLNELPVQSPALPGVDQADGEDREKHQGFNESKHTELS